VWLSWGQPPDRGRSPIGIGHDCALISRHAISEGDRLATGISGEFSSPWAAGWETASSSRGELCYQGDVESEEGASGIMSCVGSRRCAVSRRLGAVLRFDPRHP
jgi:hypothetical protein